MKHVISVATAAFFCMASMVFADAPADRVAGIWLVQSKDGKFDISRCGESLCGRLIAGTKISSLDKKNKNPDLRARPLKGLLMMQGYKLSKDGGRWVDGQIYNPEDGNSYRSILEPGPDDTLKVKGCLGPFCQTQTWTRAAP